MDQFTDAIQLRKHIATIKAVDFQAPERLVTGAGEVVERLALGIGRDRDLVVFDPEEYGQVGTRGLGHGLHDLALLRRAIAQPADDDRLGRVVLDLHRDPHGLQRVVADGDHRAGQVQFLAGHEAAHLPAGGIAVGVGQDRIEPGLGLNATRDHQGLIAVVRVQPVFLFQKQVERGSGFVPQASDLEEGFTGGAELLLDAVHGLGGPHRPVQRLNERIGGWGLGRGWRGAGVLCGEVLGCHEAVIASGVDSFSPNRLPRGGLGRTHSSLRLCWLTL